VPVEQMQKEICSEPAILTMKSVQKSMAQDKEKKLRLLKTPIN